MKIYAGPEVNRFALTSLKSNKNRESKVIIIPMEF